jgi:hypothetical protein
MNNLQAATVDEYLAWLPADRQAPASQLVELFRAALPPSFDLTMQYGMPSFVVPLARYPAGYHCQKDTPLPFLAVASQKNHLAVYHMGLYAQPDLLEWFKGALAAAGCKVDIGKSCIRFNPAKPLPEAVLRELAGKLDVDAWIACYESAVKPASKKPAAPAGAAPEGNP